jgi:integrase
MHEGRVNVWVQRFKDRKHLMLQWIDPDTGKRKSRSAGTDDEKEAERARADLEYELSHGKYQEASTMSWDRFRELFREQYVAGLREGTGDVYDMAFNAFEQICNPRKLRSINEQTISSFVTGLRKAPGNGGTMQPSTIKVRLQFLQTALRWAEHQGLIPRCPKFPAVKVPKKKPQPVATELFERLLQRAPDDNMRVYLMCGWLAGLRLGEALELEWEETDKAPYLDLDRQRIVLPAGFVKAVEDQWLPLDPQLADALKALPRNGPKVFRFVSRAGGGPLSRTGLSCRIVKLAKAAGVKLTMKTLRKGFGSRYAGKVPAQVLQKLMRHSNITITMDYYANVDQAVEEAVLGPQRNTSRNSAAGESPTSEEPVVETPNKETTNGEAP